MEMPKIDKNQTATFVVAGVLIAVIIAFLYWIYPQINTRLPSLGKSI